MATTRLLGGSALKARLEAIKGIPDAFAGIWADDTKTQIERMHPPAQRPASRRFSTRVTRARAGVYGAYWWIFVDRGTKAHDITARKAKVLRFEKGGQTIFARRTRHPRTARRPFISKAAQDALAASRFGDLVVKSWNRRRRPGRKAFL